ncbi:MAG: DUF4102 domain-containing protein [Rhodospirillales bacterium]|nr:DUF4102 domain-containing protein [Rhodospirillales bacterium]
MARVDRLSAVQVRTLREGRHADGDGLYLLVKGPEAAYWVLRYVHGGRMREMGLGPARGRRAVKLAEAREKAAALFRMHRHGIDPLEARAAEAAAHKQAAGAPPRAHSAPASSRAAGSARRNRPGKIPIGMLNGRPAAAA